MISWLQLIDTCVIIGVFICTVNLVKPVKLGEGMNLNNLSYEFIARVFWFLPLLIILAGYSIFLRCLINN